MLKKIEILCDTEAPIYQRVDALFELRDGGFEIN